ncbi:MAG: sigma-70 family RNA polymerase sigma factor [Treponema sp.]
MKNETSIYNQYLKEIKNYPLLTSDEEKELAIKIKKGNTKALEQLINSNLRLVVKIAHNYIIPSNKLMDIIQEGNIGLMTAAKKFSPDFNVRFASYACLWIKQSMNRYLSYNDELIRIPSRKATIVRNVKKFRVAFKKTNKREPFSEEISKALDIEKNQLQMLHTFIYETISSLDANISIGKKEKNTSTLYDYIASDGEENPETIYITKEISSQLDKQLDFLGERDKDILKNRYRLNRDKKVVPFHTLGEKYSISSESVRQIEIRAIKKLQARKETLLKVIPF